MRKQKKGKPIKQFKKHAHAADRAKSRRGELFAAAIPAGVEDCRGAGAKRKFARAVAAMPARPARAEQEVEGIFHGTGRGFGFVSPDGAHERAEDVFIPGGATNGALDGDRVRIRYHRYLSHRNGIAEEKTEGEVTDILTVANPTVIGRLTVEYSGFGRHRRRYAYVTPDNPRIPGEVWVRDEGGAEDGDKVEVTLACSRSRGLGGDITRVFGAADDRSANYEAILASLGVRTDFPAPVWREAAEKAAAPLTEEKGRRRLTEVIFTIDGAGAKDLDDAISLRRLPNGGWLLGVHIADVSEYVTAGSETDKEAMLRGTSIYFTDKVVPMLPPSLSNGACSLNAGEEKYALSAHMTLSPEGEIVGTRVARTIIRSRVRGVYDEVNDLFLNGKKSPYTAKYKEVLPALARMRELYEILAARGRARGAVELDRPEPIILLDEQGEPADILCRERGDAEKMIEQFMLTANEGVATLLHERGIPCVYRVHEKPEEGRFSDFLQYAHNAGLSVSSFTGENVSGRDLAALLREAEEKGISRAVSYAMLRAMAKAEYSDQPKGHFGLGIGLYCHFTSPIRRLSDLATHRILKAVLLDGEGAKKYTAYAHRAAEAASACELRALEAEREIEALYKAVYLSRRVGEECEATVSSCTAFGMFCELDNTCEGLVPIDDLDGNFVFDEGNLSLRSGDTVYRIGDRVRVVIEEVSVSHRKVRFSVA